MKDLDFIHGYLMALAFILNFPKKTCPTILNFGFKQELSHFSKIKKHISIPDKKINVSVQNFDRQNLCMCMQN